MKQKTLELKIKEIKNNDDKNPDKKAVPEIKKHF